MSEEVSSNGSRVISFFASQSLHNKKIKNKSGDVNDEANFSFFILLHPRANPILPLIKSLFFKSLLYYLWIKDKF